MSPASSKQTYCRCLIDYSSSITGQMYEAYMESSPGVFVEYFEKRSQWNPGTTHYLETAPADGEVPV